MSVPDRPERVALAEKFAAFPEQWRPKLVAEWNGQELRVVKVQGEFVWHRHEATDELFLVWRGRMRIEFRDRTVELGPGELLVVPRGVEHRTGAGAECECLVLVARDTRNTGDVTDPRLTAPCGVRV